METGRLTILIHSPQSETFQQICERQLEKFNCEIRTTRKLDELLDILAQEPVHLALAPCTQQVLHSLEEILRKSSAFAHPPPRWLLEAPEASEKNPELLQRLGVLSTTKSFTKEDLEPLLQRIEKYETDPFAEVIEGLEAATGVQLAREKRSLVESRLRRRLHDLGLTTFSQYARYFRQKRLSEIQQAISLITTHTTEFFREERHFDLLLRDIFPQILKEGKTLRIWSAACSTGQEVYSLAIAALEYCDSMGWTGTQRPAIQILGTDIDDSCLETAREGIYRSDQIQSLDVNLVERYFERGSGDLSEFVRVKDEVHALCHFERINLLADDFHLPPQDVIFLRNVLIYFSSQDIARLTKKMAASLAADGFLVLGHSESLTGLDQPLTSLGNSVYTLRSPSAQNKPQQRWLGELIAIGASTGGVEALRVILEGLRPPCPPIVIVQHIPEVFSQQLAKRLDSSCQITVLEARQGQTLQESHAYIAPGGHQMRLLLKEGRFQIEITEDPPLNSHKPSVDYLFQSITPYVTSMNLIAVILTGMGHDGAQGLLALKNAGADTIVQNEETSVVFGMPGSAVKLGAARSVLPIQEITPKILRLLKTRKNAS